MRSFGAIATLIGSILYSLGALLGRLLIDVGPERVKLHELALATRAVTVLSLLVFHIGLYDVVARFEGPDPGSPPRSRVGSASVLLGGACGTAALLVGNALLVHERTLWAGMLALAGASLPLALTCIGAPWSLNRGGAQALLSAALGIASSLALVLAGLLPMIVTSEMDASTMVTKAAPLVHPMGLFTGVCGAVYALWTFVTGIIVYRNDALRPG